METANILICIKAVSSLLDTMQSRGLLLPKEEALHNFDDDIKQLFEHEQSLNIPPPQKDPDARKRVVREILETERKYVQDLDVMSDYKAQLDSSKMFLVDTVSSLFPNLNTILDFQRRFLIGMELNASLPPRLQRFGSLFLETSKEFSQYEAFSLNQKIAIDIITKEASKLRIASSLIDPSYELQSFLIKPVQRLCKYPLLLRELIKYTDVSWPYYEELVEGRKEIMKVTEIVNELQRISENRAALESLKEKVVNWKNYTVEGCGELLHHDTVKVVSRDRDEEELQVYLLEDMIFLFREVNPNTKKSSASKKRPSHSHNSANSVFTLVGRVVVDSIKGIETNTEPIITKSGKTNLYEISILINGMQGEFVQKFRFKNEETFKQWEDTLQRLIETKEEALAQLQAQKAAYNQQQQQQQQQQQARSSKPLPPQPPMLKTSFNTKEKDDYQQSRYSPGESPLNGYRPNRISSNDPNMRSQQQQQQLQPQHNYQAPPLTKSLSTTGQQQFQQPPNFQQYDFRGRSASQPNILAHGIPNVSGYSNGSTEGPHGVHANAPPLPPIPTRIKSNIDLGQQFRNGSIPPSLPPPQPPQNTLRANYSLGRGSSIANISQTHSNTSSVSSISNNPSAHGSSSGLTNDTTLSTITPMNTQNSSEYYGGGTPSTISSGSQATVLSTLVPNSEQNQVHTKLRFENDTFTLIIAKNITFQDLKAKVEKKIKSRLLTLPSNPKIKYEDEDGDRVILQSDDDILMAIDMIRELAADANGQPVLTLWYI